MFYKTSVPFFSKNSSFLHSQRNLFYFSWALMFFYCMNRTSLHRMWALFSNHVYSQLLLWDPFRYEGPNIPWADNLFLMSLQRNFCYLLKLLSAAAIEARYLRPMKSSGSCLNEHRHILHSGFIQSHSAGRKLCQAGVSLLIRIFFKSQSAVVCAIKFCLFALRIWLVEDTFFKNVNMGLTEWSAPLLVIMNFDDCKIEASISSKML